MQLRISAGKEENQPENTVLREARRIIAKQFERGSYIKGAEDTKNLAILELNHLDQEVFACLFLDTGHAYISFEKLFFGTIDQAIVYPRIVAKRALDLHAAAIILLHNHPSGNPKPSQSDIDVTTKLTQSLKLLDIRILDHIVVGGDKTYSFAEHGMM